MEPKNFLIYCKYDYWCQGVESTWGYFFVEANSFDGACYKLSESKKFKNAGLGYSNFRDFEDRTL
jgi:hypothetical protein